MDLTFGATATEIKSRYKQLVKKHHPDANGGDRGPKTASGLSFRPINC